MIRASKASESYDSRNPNHIMIDDPYILRLSRSRFVEASDVSKLHGFVIKYGGPDGVQKFLADQKQKGSKTSDIQKKIPWLIGKLTEAKSVLEKVRHMPSSAVIFTPRGMGETQVARMLNEMKRFGNGPSISQLTEKGKEIYARVNKLRDQAESTLIKTGMFKGGADNRAKTSALNVYSPRMTKEGKTVDDPRFYAKSSRGLKDAFGDAYSRNLILQLEKELKKEGRLSPTFAAISSLLEQSVMLQRDIWKHVDPTKFRLKSDPGRIRILTDIGTEYEDFKEEMRETVKAVKQAIEYEKNRLRQMRSMLNRIDQQNAFGVFGYDPTSIGLMSNIKKEINKSEKNLNLLLSRGQSLQNTSNRAWRKFAGQWKGVYTNGVRTGSKFVEGFRIGDLPIWKAMQIHDEYFAPKIERTGRGIYINRPSVKLTLKELTALRSHIQSLTSTTELPPEVRTRNAAILGLPLSYLGRKSTYTRGVDDDWTDRAQRDPRDTVKGGTSYAQTNPVMSMSIQALNERLLENQRSEIARRMSAGIANNRDRMKFPGERPHGDIWFSWGEVSGDPLETETGEEGLVWSDRAGKKIRPQIQGPWKSFNRIWNKISMAKTGQDITEAAQLIRVMHVVQVRSEGNSEYTSTARPALKELMSYLREKRNLIADPSLERFDEERDLDNWIRRIANERISDVMGQVKRFWNDWERKGGLMRDENDRLVPIPGVIPGGRQTFNVKGSDGGSNIFYEGETRTPAAERPGMLMVRGQKKASEMAMEEAMQIASAFRPKLLGDHDVGFDPRTGRTFAVKSRFEE